MEAIPRAMAYAVMLQSATAIRERAVCVKAVLASECGGASSARKPRRFQWIESRTKPWLWGCICARRSVFDHAASVGL